MQTLVTDRETGTVYEFKCEDTAHRFASSQAGSWQVHTPRFCIRGSWMMPAQWTSYAYGQKLSQVEVQSDELPPGFMYVVNVDECEAAL